MPSLRRSFPRTFQLVEDAWLRRKLSISLVYIVISYVVLLPGMAAETLSQTPPKAMGADLASRRAIAKNLFLQQHFAQSAAELLQIIKQDSNHAEDYYWLGEDYMHQARYSEAASAFNRALQLNPSMDSCYVPIVQCHLSANDAPMALRYCNQGMATAKDQFTRKQLETLNKVAARGHIVLPKGDMSRSADGPSKK